jgi:hypothetical protein
LAKAKTLECVFDFTIGTLSYDGSLVLAEGNRACVQINEATEGRSMRLLIVSDGTRRSFQDNGIGQPQLGDTPKNLNAEIVTWVARSGVFLPHAPLPDVRVDEAKDQFRVSGFQLGKKEKVGEQEKQRLEYQLSVRGLEFSVAIWLDLNTGLPIKRLVTQRGQQTTVVETYPKLTLNEKVDAKKFDLPK